MPGLLLGAAGGGFVALAFAVMSWMTGIPLHSLSLFLIPIGGTVVGAAAGAAFVVGTMGAIAAPTRARYAVAAALGALIYAVLCWLSWLLEAPEAPFWYWVSPESAVIAWAGFLLQFPGAALGALLVFYLAAHDLEPCPVCAKGYRKATPLFHAENGDAEEVIAKFRGLKPEKVGEWLTAGRAAAGAQPARGQSRFAVRLVACQRAECGAARLSAGKRAETAAGDFGVGREENVELRRELVSVLSA